MNSYRNSRKYSELLCRDLKFVGIITYPQFKQTERILEFPSLGFSSIYDLPQVLSLRPLFSGQVKTCLGKEMKSNNIWIQLIIYVDLWEGN